MTTLEVRLPWLDPRTVPRSGDTIDLCAGFWRYLRRPAYRDETAARMRATFRELDSRPRLAGPELFVLNNAARAQALLEHLATATRPGPALFDEYLCRLSEAHSWFVRLAFAIPLPAASLDAFAGKTDDRLLDDFDRFLETRDSLARHESASAVCLPLVDLGQLPFAARFARFARRAHPNITVEVRDEIANAPGASRWVAAELEASGARLTIPEVPALPRRPGRARAEALAGTRGWLRIGWRPALDELASGRAAKALARELDWYASRRIKVALAAALPLAAGFEAGERALFSAFDAIVAGQWQIQHLRITAAPQSPATDNFEAWQTQWQTHSASGDVFQTQIEAELENHRLAPHLARLLPLDGKGVKIRSAPRSTIASRYPLDGLSDEDPSVIAWPHGYGRRCASLEAEIEVEAAARRKRYHICVGGRLIFSSRRDVAVLEQFDRPRSAPSVVRRSARLGLEMSDVEALLAENVLVGERRRPRKPRQRSSKRSNKRGYLHFAGIGPGGPEMTDPRTLAAIADAERVWIQDLGLPGLERTSIRARLDATTVINTVGYYGTGHLRSFSRLRFYTLAARRAIDLAMKGHEITMVFSGSPVVWVDAFTIARQYLEQHPDFDLRLSNAMSFLDSVFIPTPIGGITSLQLRIASISDPDISPHVDCVIGQVGDTGQPHGVGERPETISEALTRLYPADHPVYIVGNDEIDAEPLYVESTASEVTELLPAYARWYLCLVIPSLANAAVIRGLPERERQRQRLTYLVGDESR